MGSPNAIAYAVMVAFVPLAIVIFGVLRPALAAIVLSCIGSLFLPERTEFDVPGLPPMNKRTLVHLAILIGLAVQRPGLLRHVVPRRPVEYLPWLSLLLLLGGAVGTAATNGDATPFSSALGSRDAISIIVGDLLRYAIPFAVGWCLFRSSSDLRALLVTIVGFGLAYSLLTFWEGRMSPQLHLEIYGFHQDEVFHVARWGGFRPAVFMNNGLAVGLYMAVAFTAAGALLRARISVFNLSPLATLPYLGAALVFCKSTAAIIYGMGLVPATILLRARVMSLLAVCMALLVISYPLARWTGVFPTEALTELSFQVNEDRGDSLQFRFENEDILLGRALERPAFGWGIKDRSAVYDHSTGEKESTVDGYWILLFGGKGLVGWVCVFAILLLPIFRAWPAIPRISSRETQLLLASLSLIVATFAIDMLPNGFFTNQSFFLSGSLFGLAGALPGESARSRAQPPARSEPPPLPEAKPSPARGRMTEMR